MPTRPLPRRSAAAHVCPPTPATMAPATVKIVTYDHIKYGTLEGVVEQISPDAIADEKTKEYTFPVVVRTTKTYMGQTPGQFPVQPGMMAEVDFKIGKRTILSYLTEQ